MLNETASARFIFLPSYILALTFYKKPAHIFMQATVQNSLYMYCTPIFLTWRSHELTYYYTEYCEYNIYNIIKLNLILLNWRTLLLSKICQKHSWRQKQFWQTGKKNFTSKTFDKQNKVKLGKKRLNWVKLGKGRVG